MLELVMLWQVASSRPLTAHSYVGGTATVIELLTYGDSKTVSMGYQLTLAAGITASNPTLRGNCDMYTVVGGCALARSGYTVAQMKALVDNDLWVMNATPAPAFILFNLGVNDANSLPPQAQWQADAGYILDAFHTKWPSAKVYMMRVWKRGSTAACATLNGWIPGVISTRSAWAFLGPDESVFLENGDDGVTYTADGTHPNAAGYVLTANQWKAAIGY